MTRCDFRTCRECSCEPTECRVQNLGTFTKTPAFTFTTRDMAITAVLIIAATIAVASTVPAAFERVRMANQEDAR